MIKSSLDPNSLLLQIKYHGYSYHGWVMQKDLPSIEGTLRATWQKVFQYPIRAFAASRTDAHVHALDQWVKVMAKNEIQFTENDLLLLNQNLPADIQVLKFQKVPKGFNIIGAASKKEYCYLFANQLPTNLLKVEEKILHFIEPLDFQEMQKAAKCFIGVHNFKNFQRREKSSAVFTREVLASQISIITHWEGVELDQSIFCYQVEAKGFLRQMVRIMMGAILNAGQGKITLENLELSLRGDTNTHVGFVSPGYGLYLKKITF